MENLSQEHLAMLRDESGISDEVIKARGYRTVTDIKVLQECGFSRAQWRVPGLLLPVHNTAGNNTLFVYRPDNPRIVENKKKRLPDGTCHSRVLKYELPKGCKTALDCPPASYPYLTDPSVGLWITEGQKKADALVSRGLCAIALIGVWNWRGQNGKGGLARLPDWDEVVLNRQVNIVFDSDALNKAGVRQALERLKRWLQFRKAVVGVVYLPPGKNGRVGVDDWLVEGHTVAQLNALLEAPRPALQAAPATIELLDEPPACISRPMALIGGQSFAATWLYCRVTRSETVTSQGEIVTHNPPIVIKERRLYILRGDGRDFPINDDGMVGNLDIEAHLPEAPPDSKILTTKGFKSYRKGARVNPVTVFGQMVDVVDRFLDFDRSLADQKTMCEMVACYALSTWFTDAFNVVGYLWPNGPRGSGKTVFLHTVAQLSYLGQVILAGGSYASLRDLADYGATLAFDDAENLDGRKADPDKRALLLAGNRRGSLVSVKELTASKTWKTRYVNTFCPRLFSAIKLPDNVLASRSIVVPLVRTIDRQKANADPLDFDLWPHDQRQLTDDLWKLALAYLPELQAHDKNLAGKASLIGRNLDPWRGILAVADWLDVDGLWKKMDDLSVAYQTERADLEKGDMASLTLKALCQCAISSISAITVETPFFDVTVSEVKDAAKDVVGEDDPDAVVDWITSRKIGRVLSQMRLEQRPRPGGKGSRIYRVTLGDLERWLGAYGLPMPDTLKLNGTNGTNGTMAQSPEVPKSPEEPGKPSSPRPVTDDFTFTCLMCGGKESWPRPSDGKQLCVVCIPPHNGGER